MASDNYDGFASLIGDLDRLGFDSVWLPEVFTSGALDPLAGLGFAAGHVKRLNIGTHLVVPDRNPVRLARELATLDRVSGGRLLLLFVIGIGDGPELAALGLEKTERGRRLEQVLETCRRLWAGEEIEGGIRVEPRPVQEPLEVWLGGVAPSALRRTARLADGWMPGLCPPQLAGELKAVIEAEATAVGRQIDPGHFGVNVTYAMSGIPDETRARVEQRLQGGTVDELIPTSWEAMRDLVGRYIDVGFTKFVARPTVPPAKWAEELDELAAELLQLQT